MKRFVPVRRPILILACVALLAACSQQAGNSASSAAQPAAQADSAAARNLDTYRQLLRIHNDEMAVTIGKSIVKQYPDSDAAKEVQKTLPEIERRYTEASEKSRLDRLWLYQVSPMAGGTQSTAAIDSSKPAGNDSIKLILRRHTEWGLNVFLYGSKPGFVCKGNCTINAEIDGKPTRIKAYAPQGGEPALMIREDKGFIKTLEKAGKISMDVTLVETDKKETLVFETAGFDPSKWQELPKGKKK